MRNPGVMLSTYSAAVASSLMLDVLICSNCSWFKYYGELDGNLLTSLYHTTQKVLHLENLSLPNIRTLPSI